MLGFHSSLTFLITDDKARLNCTVEEMVLCSFTNCKKVADQAVELICCRLLACLACASPGFYEGPKTCPKCSKSITKGEFIKKTETRKKIDQLKNKWEKRKDRNMSLEERLRFKEAIACKVCKELCSKAVSLACCPSASCRKCALAKLKEDNTKCWSCGVLSVDVHTPSQLVNNDLVRIGVTFFKEKQLDRSCGTFEIFVLLFNTDVSEESEIRDRLKNERLLKRKLADNAAKERERETAVKERETKPLSDCEQAQLQRLLVRNKTKLERNGEPIQKPASQFEVRDIFTGTGSVIMNKKLAKGKRHFDGTTVQTYKVRKSTFTEIGPPPTWHPPPDSRRRGGKKRMVEGLLDQNTSEKIAKAWIKGENLATVETKSEFWKYN